MAASDAKPIPIKNQAYRAYFAIYDADGDPVAGAAGLDSEVSKDGGALADCTNEATEIGQGIYYLDLTASEMNADGVVVIVKTTTSGAKTTVLTMYPKEPGDIVDVAYKKNIAHTNYMFLMVDDTDGKTPETGLTGITCQRSIDAGAFAACANSASEVGNGWYKIDLAASDLNGDEIILRFTKTSVARNWEHKIRTVAS